VVIPYNGSASVAPLNFSGLWWAAPAGSEAGWALNIWQEGDVIVATWSTYDANGKPWWLAMATTKGAGNTYSGTFYETRGPGFNAPFDPTKVSTWLDREPT